jgi:hypothetical protein
MDPADTPTTTRRTALKTLGVGFTTLAVAGTAAGSSLSVTTDWADKYGDTEWILGGTLDALGDATEAYCYFELRPEGDDAWRTTEGTTLSQPDSYTATTGTVEPGVTYEYRAVAETSSGRVTGTTNTFYAYVSPTLTTGDVTSLEEDRATATATLEALGSADSCAVWFSYRVSGGSWQETDRQTLSSPGEFAADLTGLSADSEYEYRARAEGDDGTYGYGGGRTFTTDTLLGVTTDAVTALDENAATLEGTLTDTGGADSVSVGFTYYNLATSTGYRVDAGELTANGSFEARASDLDPETDYEFRATATGTDGDSARGDALRFTTDSLLGVETTGATDIEPTAATLTADLTDLGDADSVDVTFEYRRVGADAWVAGGVETVSTTGTVRRRVDGLDDDTDYEYRTTATGSDGDADAGGTATFTTPVGNEAPTVESLSAYDSSPPNPHAELNAEWTVADADGNLASVDVTIRDSAGRSVYTDTRRVSGGETSGSEYTEVKKGDGESYTVSVLVTDSDGATGSDELSFRA